MLDPESETSVSAEAQDALTSLLVLMVLAQAGDWPALTAALPRPSAPGSTASPPEPDPPSPEDPRPA